MRPAKIAVLPRAGTVPIESARRRPDPDRWARWIGLGLMAAFLLQDLGGLSWAWLEQLQADGTYRQLSGLALVAFLAHQWHLAALRGRGKIRQAGALMRSHKLAGALAPLVFYAHSQQLGYAYLGALSSAFFAAFVSGLLHQPIARLHKPGLQMLWITAHLGAAVILLALLGYHVYIAYAYR